MAEYIDREALKKNMTFKAQDIRIKWLGRFKLGVFVRFKSVENAVENTPAADVVEVRHGRWIEENDGTHSCSECGHDATYTYDGTEICGIGCPFCYALMDGKGEG